MVIKPDPPTFGAREPLAFRFWPGQPPVRRSSTGRDGGAPACPEVAGASGARVCDPQQYPSARTYTHENQRIHESGHGAAVR